MNTFLLDLWHDLRAKRLWPVAVLLVVALAAIPLVLKKHASTPAATSAASAAPAAGADSGKAIVVADSDTSKNSTLGVFNKKDPFKPDKAVLAAAHPKPAPAPSNNQPSGGSNGGGGSQPSGGNSQPSGGNPGGGSNGGGAPAQPAPQPVQPPKPQGPFAYTVDVKFGRFGKARTHHNVQKLDVLPNQNNPLLVFLGVNSAGNTAVFLTDTSLKAAGEGSCKPDGNTCSFLYLKLDKNHNSEDLSEQAADGTGTEYTLTLLAIHKVPVSQLAKGAKKAAAAARAEARRAHIEHHRAATPFRVPFGLQLQPDTVG
jgi:hypothetical protein